VNAPVTPEKVVLECDTVRHFDVGGTLYYLWKINSFLGFVFENGFMSDKEIGIAPGRMGWVLTMAKQSRLERIFPFVLENGFVSFTEKGIARQDVFRTSW
jgi:hypothetical protein